jgi:hypothetical protein
MSFQACCIGFIDYCSVGVCGICLGLHTFTRIALNANRNSIYTAGNMDAASDRNTCADFYVGGHWQALADTAARHRGFASIELHDVPFGHEFIVCRRRCG